LGGRPETAHRLGHHLAVAQGRRRGLELRLELVVAVEQLAGALLAEHARELRAHAAPPVDEGAVAVEGRPALSHAPDRTRAAPHRAGPTSRAAPGSRAGAPRRGA